MLEQPPGTDTGTYGRDLVFSIHRLRFLTPEPMGLSAASESLGEVTEFYGDGEVGILLVLMPDGQLKVHVTRCELPLSGVRVVIERPAASAVGQRLGLTNERGEATLGSISQFPPPSAGTLYRLLVRIPLPGS